MMATSLTGVQLVDAHRSAVRKLRILSVVFPLVFIALIAGYLWSIVNQVRDIDAAALGSELSDRVNSLMPDINHSLGELADTAQPALVHALETESLAMAPQIEKRLQSDVDQTVASARSDLQGSVSRAMELQSEKQREALLFAFPILAEDRAAQDKVLASVKAAMTQWQLHQLDATIAEHVIAIEELRSTLQSSYTHPAGTPADPEDALMTWLNLMNEHVGGEQPILAAPEPATKAATKKTPAGGK